MIRMRLYAFTLTLFVNFVKKSFQISEKTLKSLLSNRPAPLKVGTGADRRGSARNYKG
jgi:hypothetical protein